jgi:hypothetical protein
MYQLLFTLEERTSITHWTESWVALRADLDTEARGKILASAQVSEPGCPVCIQTVLIELPKLLQ